MKRYLIPDYGWEDSIKLGLEILFEEIENDPNLNDIKLLVPTRNNMKHTSIETVLGEKRCKTLLDGKNLSLTQGKTITLDTTKTISHFIPLDAILVVYADQNMMDIVDSIPNLKLVISVSRSPTALNNWKSTWNPIIPGEESKNEESLLKNKIVEVALTSVTIRINLSNSVLNPRDESCVKDTLYILRANNQFEDPVNLRNWAIRNNWQPKAADELMKYAERIFTMSSKPRKYGQEWRDDIYDYWKAESEK